jgi:hypothetical protein
MSASNSLDQSYKINCISGNMRSPSSNVAALSLQMVEGLEEVKLDDVVLIRPIQQSDLDNSFKIHPHAKTLIFRFGEDPLLLKEALSDLLAPSTTSPAAQLVKMVSALYPNRIENDAVTTQATESHVDALDVAKKRPASPSKRRRRLSARPVGNGEPSR